MSSIFTKIINGDIPSYKVYETEKFLAFLDVRPLKRGHVLCVPKLEVDYIFDLDEVAYCELMLFSKKVATAIKKTISCKKVGMVVIGLEVPHTHVHLIPLDAVGDVNFSKFLTLPASEMSEIAEKIAKEIL